MTQLPADFTERTRQLMGEERFGRYLKSFEDVPPVSIRLNPRKKVMVKDGEPVPWCRNGYYLKQRPNFTFDPSTRCSTQVATTCRKPHRCSSTRY